jgi:hypothetical protein
MIDKVQKIVNMLSPRTIEGNPKPHKFAVILSLIDLFDNNQLKSERFFLTDDLDDRFKHNMILLAPDFPAQNMEIVYPLYSMSNDGIWRFVIKPEMLEEFERIRKELHGRFTKKRLCDTVDYAIMDPDLILILQQKESRDMLRGAVFSQFKVSDEKETYKPEQVDHTEQDHLFCTYISSLISTNTINENAIAESQATNPMFNTIHIEHPLVEVLCEELKKRSGKHVILTGHAGDGKTTIAVDVLKRLRGISFSSSLDDDLMRREEIDEYGLSLIKDFSERDSTFDKDLIGELKSNARRFLIVSNTGTLLDFYKDNAREWNTDKVSAESKLLKAISSSSGFSNVEFGNTDFQIYNLAHIDNIGLAKEIFKKMICSDNWQECISCAHEGFCPIKENVELIQSEEGQITDRLFLLYRRMREYGSRLTIRQLTSHMAYMIGSGLGYNAIGEKASHFATEYMFFNRLFGDNGKMPDNGAKTMRAIVEIDKHNFGGIYSSDIELNLWLHYRERRLKVSSSVENTWLYLQKLGINPKSGNMSLPNSDMARTQVRRILYFFIQDENKNDSIITQFLLSPNILKWQRWQIPHASISESDRFIYANMVYHVLQEQFTGLRIPENSIVNESRLYITLSRKQDEVKPNTQIAIADIDKNQSFSLVLKKNEKETGESSVELCLKGQGVLQGLELDLKLPFLDYVTQRHYGEVGNLLSPAYQQRLESLKNQIIKKTESLDSNMMLISLKNDSSFKRQTFEISNDRMEVFNV